MVTRTGPGVLAGIDTSPDSVAVANLAAAEALRRGIGLRLVYSRSAPAAHWEPGLEQLADTVRAAHPDLAVTLRACEQELADELVDQSTGAALIAVSARLTGGHDPILDRWLTNRVITHAHCPVLVLGHDPGRYVSAAEPRPVLVGIDGSEHSIAAIPHAFEAAELRQVPLRAAAVRGIAAHPAGTCVGPAGAEHADACAYVTEALADWPDKFPHVQVITEPMYGPDVAQALIDASAEADLVVVGARGRSGVTCLLLGSVSRALVERAHCPVLIAHAYEHAPNIPR